MPDPISAGIGAVTSIGSGIIQGKAAKKAGRTQANAINAAIGEQRNTYGQIRSLLSPYANAGGPAVQGLMDLAGLGSGPDWNGYLQANPDVAAEYQRIQGEGRFASPQDFAEWHYNTYGRGEGRQLAQDDPTGRQQAAYDEIANSPGFQAIARQGEDAINQNASATGGLRGGNTQGALARFRPQLLDQFIERQFGRLGGIAQIGQNAAGATANAAGAMGGNIADLLVGRGQAQAGAIGAQGQIWSNVLGQIGGMGANAFGGGMNANNVARLTPSVQRTMNQNPGIF